MKLAKGTKVEVCPFWLDTDDALALAHYDGCRGEVLDCEGAGRQRKVKVNLTAKREGAGVKYLPAGCLRIVED